MYKEIVAKKKLSLSQSLNDSFFLNQHPNNEHPNNEHLNNQHSNNQHPNNEHPKTKLFNLKYVSSPLQP